MAGSRNIVSARELDLLRRLLRERTEELERANERLFMASQVKSEFLSHMSREFQRPLDRIVDFASCLRDGSMGEVNPDQRRCLEGIIIRGMRLQRMLERVLELCNSDLGMAVFLPREFPVRDALDRVMKRLRGRAEKQGVDIDVGCVDGGDTLTADEGKFSFIIEELATNALKFSPKGSRVTVRLRDVTANGLEERFLEVAVSDQGQGIREEELGQIFKSFEMGSGVVAGPGSLGLGLALVKHFVDLHGGRIAVESRAGEGSTFTVLIPKGGPAVRMVRTPRVLVAGLEGELLGPLLARLREEGYDTITAGGGQDALDKGISMALDLCILSLSLPEVGGVDVCLRLKAHERSKQIPIIITAPDRSAKVRSAQAGADGFFVLPAELGELLLKARSLIAQKLNYDFLKRNYEIAASEAFSDPLTGLFNLRQFWLSLDRELARARRYRRPCSLAMIDIDFFKQYNDRHGHLRGDEVLKEVGGIFGASIRNSDIAARYGGEEFVVIMPETGRDLALIAGEKLRRAVADHPFPLQETQPGGVLTVSVGIATFPDDAATARELVDAADQALYRAKRRGRNRVEIHGAPDRG